MAAGKGTMNRPENLPEGHFVLHKRHMDSPGMNTDFRDWKPATKA
jgi:hypothetical protein